MMGDEGDLDNVEGFLADERSHQHGDERLGAARLDVRHHADGLAHQLGSLLHRLVHLDLPSFSLRF